jgi:CheY-like chemotaxis protein
MDALSSLQDLRVLVVEDNEDAAEALGLVLEHCGAQVRVSHGARVGLAIAAEFLPDVIVTDIAMPEVDGYGLLRQLHAQPEPLCRRPVIALSAFEAEEHRKRALVAGFHMYLTKPVNLAELTYAIALIAAPRETSE